MDLLCFATSNSQQSINKQLVSYAATTLKDKHNNDARIEVLDLNDYEMPIYSIDRENADGIPALAKQLFARIGSADALLISFAEHNGHLSAAYKNIFDWMSRIDSKVYQNKPCLMLATSPGPGGASSVLNAAKISAPFFAMNSVGDLSVPSFYDNFDMDNAKLKNQQLEENLTDLLAKLASTAAN